MELGTYRADSRALRRLLLRPVAGQSHRAVLHSPSARPRQRRRQCGRRRTDADALGRALVADVMASGDLPPFPSSAMDGYAVQPGPPGRSLAVVGESRAGRPAELELQDGQAVRISTGAAVPAGASAVIRQEDVAEADDQIVTQAETPARANIRAA